MIESIDFINNLSAHCYTCSLCVREFRVYLLQEGTTWKRTLALTGSNITSAIYDPYLADKGEVIYDGINSSKIATFTLEQDSTGVWSVDGKFTIITANLEDGDGNLLTIHSIGIDSVNVKLFRDLTAMREWLKS